MPKVKVALDNVPSDASVSVPYLGKFTNNTTTEVDETRWARYLKHQPGALDTDTLELTTERSEELSEAHKKAGQVSKSDSRDELDLAARAVGLNPKEFSTKEELAGAIESQVHNNPNEEG